ncbi:MAG: hypothetical protein KC983_01920 [Phycisphaerales bacterium]|nr:hypothetical protein [Phycisphaerales bacterium]
MKNATACTKALTTLLKSLDMAIESAGPDQDDPIAVLVYSFLLWESTTTKAMAAYEKVRHAVVDFNDLRICMPHETVAFIGSNYPRALDRCQRLRAALRDIYLREHAVTLERLVGLGKRDARKYIETLDGTTPYVAERLMVVSFGIHGMPVDEQLRTQLIDAGVLEEGIEVPEAISWLTRQIKSADSRQAHLGLQAWMDAQAEAPRSKKKSTSRKTSSRTTSKKTASKSSTKRKSTRRKSSKATGS